MDSLALFMHHLRGFMMAHNLPMDVPARLAKCAEEDQELHEEGADLRDEALDRLITSLALLDGLGVVSPFQAAYEKLQAVIARPEYQELRKASKEVAMKREEEKFIQAPDGSGLPREEGWFSPTANPFLHGCCDCGLVHKVEFTVVDTDGVEQIFPTHQSLALRFSRDDQETAKIRLTKACANPTPEAMEIISFLSESVPTECVAVTQFGGVKINELDRDSLLRLVALLAAGKPDKAEPSRIITL